MLIRFGATQVYAYSVPKSFFEAELRKEIEANPLRWVAG